MTIMNKTTGVVTLHVMWNGIVKTKSSKNPKLNKNVQNIAINHLFSPLLTKLYPLVLVSHSCL